MGSGGPKESCVRWGPDPPREGAILVIRGAHCKVSCAKTAEPIDLPFGLWTQVGRRKHKFNRDQVRSLDYAVHSCFRKIFATTDQSVVEQCMIFFECHHVQDTVRDRKRKFLHKFKNLTNQLCMAFNDRATADLELW